MIPHCASFDLVQRADVRNSLCRKPRDFITPALHNRFAWPKRIEDAIETDYETGSLRVTEEFSGYASDLCNWTYGSTYVHAFPELLHLVQVKDP